MNISGGPGQMSLSVVFDYLTENLSYRAEFNSTSIYLTCRKLKLLVQFLYNGK